MILSEKAYKAINNVTVRAKIALALGIGEQSVVNAIRLKRDLLTKAAAMQVIKAETGLTEEEILQQEEAA